MEIYKVTLLFDSETWSDDVSNGRVNPFHTRILKKRDLFGHKWEAVTGNRRKLLNVQFYRYIAIITFKHRTVKSSERIDLLVTTCFDVRISSSGILGAAMRQIHT
jgi:hypothetical protein